MGERARLGPSSAEQARAREPSGPSDRSPHERSLAVQSSAGNRAAIAFVQPLLKVGRTDDAYEREADAVADAVVRGDAAPAPTPVVPAVQRLAGDPAGDEGGSLDAHTTAELRAETASGASLPASVRERLEPALGRRLDGVRVHTDHRAADLADRIGARAFTHGRDIFFGRGEYQPGNDAGLRTIAHEATHVVQQTAGGGVQSVQRLKNPLRALKKLGNRMGGKTNVIGDQDVAKQTAGGTASANQVSKVKLKDSVGGNKNAFFKEQDTLAQSQYAVASSRLARGMGMGGVIARNKFGNIGGKTGAVSGGVKGVPLKEEVYDTNMAAFGSIDPTMAEMQDWKQVDGPKGDYFARSRTDINDIDFKNPVTQKGLADLQLFDAITGQIDRHGGNIFVDPKTGKVTGIDDDLSFGRGHSRLAPGDKGYDASTDGLTQGAENFLGLPSQVDAGTAKKILGIKPEKLDKILVRPGDPHQLKPEQIEAAKKRLLRVQEHIRKLAEDDKLIGEWNDETYDAAMAEGNRTHDGKATTKSDEKSYLKRSVNMLEAARRGDTVDGFEQRVKGASGPEFGPKPDPNPKPKPTVPAVNRRRIGNAKLGPAPKPPPLPDPETARKALAEVGFLAAQKGRDRQNG